VELKKLLKAVTSGDANYARWAMRNGTNGNGDILPGTPSLGTWRTITVILRLR